MQGYCGVYKWTILKRMSPEVKCLHLTSSRREMCTLSVSNVIYLKFSHGAAFYTLNGKNVNVMLELFIYKDLSYSLHLCLTSRDQQGTNAVILKGVYVFSCSFKRGVYINLAKLSFSMNNFISTLFVQVITRGKCKRP